MRARFTSRHEGAYLVIIGVMLLCRASLLPADVDAKNTGQSLALEWWFPIAIAVYGVLGIILAREARFPDVLPAQTSTRRWLVAIALGLLTGALSSYIDWIKPIAPIYGLQSVHHPPPWSIPYYVYGGIVSEIIYHLVPVVVIVWIGTRLSGGSNALQERIFWVTVIVLSAWEQKQFFTQPELWNPIEFARNVVSFAANAFEIWLLRRWGFAMALTQRLASYSIWHIVWPAISGT